MCIAYVSSGANAQCPTEKKKKCTVVDESAMFRLMKKEKEECAELLASDYMNSRPQQAAVFNQDI